jgi:hypothetical protein
MDMAEAAIQALKSGLTPANKNISYLVIGEYSKQITGLRQLKDAKASKAFTRLERELQDKAFQAERDEIQNLYEKGHITLEVARKIRQQINIRETYWMDENSIHV